MTNDDIVAGKAGFQKADLMDYGSLYGMGSYFGQDYTAWTLIRLARLIENDLARQQFGGECAPLPAVQQAAIRDAMRAQLQGIDLTQWQVTIPDALASAMTELRGDIARKFASADLETGWTPAYSLGPDDALRTADFLIYCALTTVARRPATTWSWTENWPFELEVVTRPPSTRFGGRGSASASLSSHLESFCSSTNFG
jgi:nitric oxide reductase subunit B